MKNFFLVKNYFFILRDHRKFYEKKVSIFKPLSNFIIKSSKFLKKKGPSGKIIIDNEDNINNTNIKINHIQNAVDNDIKDNTKEYSKNIIIEIPNAYCHKFKVKKVFFNSEKKKGRKRKSSTSKKFVHTKYYRDNILRKIKVKFMEVLIKYINRIILTKYKTEIKKLLPLEREISQNITINHNKILLNMKLKDIFTNFKISRKFKFYDDSYNKNVIETIYEKNIMELMNILDKTFLEVFMIFKGVSVNEANTLSGMEKLNDVLEEIKTKENDINYIDKLSNVAKNFENFFIPQKLKNE